MPERMVRAPDLEWLTRKQAAQWLNIGVDAFDALVKAFGIQPINVGPRTLRWHWKDVVAREHQSGRKDYAVEE